MLGEAVMGLSALKTAFDMTKGLKDIDNAVSRNAAVIELQENILTAQQAQAALIKRIDDLEKEVARFETWEAEKERYKLTDLGHGMTTYTLKEGMENGEPPHHLCADCYNHGQKSVMQTETRSPGRAQVLVCHTCGLDLYVYGMRDPSHKSYKRGREHR